MSCACWVIGIRSPIHWRGLFDTSYSSASARFSLIMNPPILPLFIAALLPTENGSSLGEFASRSADHLSERPYAVCRPGNCRISVSKLNGSFQSSNPENENLLLFLEGTGLHTRLLVAAVAASDSLLMSSEAFASRGSFGWVVRIPDRSCSRSFLSSICEHSEVFSAQAELFVAKALTRMKYEKGFAGPS